jgi:hypothetical protein
LRQLQRHQTDDNQLNAVLKIIERRIAVGIAGSPAATFKCTRKPKLKGPKRIASEPRWFGHVFR